MSKRSKCPYHELKRLRRHMAVLGLKYQHAEEDGKSLVCERLARKAAHIMERIDIARATIAVMFRRDWDEAKKLNGQFDEVVAFEAAEKEKQDDMVQRNPDSGESN